MAKAQRQSGSNGQVGHGATNYRFEPVKLESLFEVLDAVSWLEWPTGSEVAQFAGIDPRTAGKALKNAMQAGLVDCLSSKYSLAAPYPYQGSAHQKQAAVRDVLVRMPLLISVRQFLSLGDKLDIALRKGATLVGVRPYIASNLAPLIRWAETLHALQPGLIAEDLVEEAVISKEQRHKDGSKRVVAFLSHGSGDKPFIRQLATDLTANDIDVWLDEQKIRVGDSIPDKIAQGLAESDYFLIAMSQKSATSEWVKKELNNALVSEVKKRDVHVIPLKLDDTAMPTIISDKKYADFSVSYKAGLGALLAALKGSTHGQ